MAFVFQHPLLATEHGEFDVGAEALAFALARQHGLRLDGVLPLLSNPEFEAAAPAQAARADAQAAARRVALLEQAAAAGVAFELCVRRGPALHVEIVDEARARGTDLIVIRRRGQRGFLAHLLVGEMVSQVLAHAPCSVLIAPRGARPWQRGVLVGVDPQSPDPALVARAAGLAAVDALPLTLVAVATDDKARAAAEQALATLAPQARALGAPVHTELRSGRVAPELVSAAQAHGADLLVVGRHAASPSTRGLIGGNAKRVLGLAAGPVLVHIEGSKR